MPNELTENDLREDQPIENTENIMSKIIEFLGLPVSTANGNSIACNCLTGHAFIRSDGGCECSVSIPDRFDSPRFEMPDNNETVKTTVVTLNGLPANAVNTGVVPAHLRRRRINPCLGKQAQTGYRYVPTSDGLCVLINEATGKAVTETSKINAGSTAVATTTDIGSAVSSQMSALLNNKTLLYVGLAGLAYYLVKKK